MFLMPCGHLNNTVVYSEVFLVLISWGHGVLLCRIMMYCGGMKLVGLRDVSDAKMAEWWCDIWDDEA